MPRIRLRRRRFFKKFKSRRPRRVFRKKFGHKASPLSKFNRDEIAYIQAVTNPFRQGIGGPYETVKILDSDNSSTISAVLVATSSVTPKTVCGGTDNTAPIIIQALMPGSTAYVGYNITCPGGSTTTVSTTTTAQTYTSGSTFFTGLPSSGVGAKARICAMGMHIYPISAAENTSGTIICGNAKHRIQTAANTVATEASALALLNTNNPMPVARGVTIRTPPEQYNMAFHAFPDTAYNSTYMPEYYTPMAVISGYSATTVLQVRVVIYLEVQIPQSQSPFPIAPSPSSLYWNEILAIVSSDKFPLVTTANSFKDFIGWARTHRASKYSGDLALRALAKVNK